MAKIYYDLIRKGLRTIDDVPLRWRDEVQELLDADTGSAE
jgi:hypothetical protein